MKGTIYSTYTALFIFAFSLGVIVTDWHHNNREPVQITPYIEAATVHRTTVYRATVIHGSNLREKIACEFDEPLKYINLIMHWYDSNDEMYADYITLADQETVDENEEIWGWSNCIWQPSDSWAACDVYIVKPEFVYADMNVDTIGHEVIHGACGDYHE